MWAQTGTEPGICRGVLSEVIRRFGSYYFGWKIDFDQQQTWHCLVYRGSGNTYQVGTSRDGAGTPVHVEHTRSEIARDQRELLLVAG